MAWSTRQLADLAGTTVKAVRHYHEIGLLDLPERRSNGYKQYEVPHLVRLLQIKRLVDLGVPLSQVASMGRADQEPDEAIRLLDVELAATIERLQRVRAELAVILRYRAPVDLPVAFSAFADELTTEDKSMLTIYSRVFDETWIDELRQLMQDEKRTDADTAFEALPADADLATRKQLADDLAPAMRVQFEKYPGLGDSAAHSPGGAAMAESTVTQALWELYNKAQLEVLYRASLIAQDKTEDLEVLEAAVLEAAARDDAGADPAARPTTLRHPDEWRRR